MNAEIIAVGSEMLTPARVDTNSLFLTDELNKLGVEVVFKCVVGDSRERLADTIRLACSRSQLVLLSGGLGPTEDDVTRDAAAQAAGRKQIFHPEIATALEERFRKAGRVMAEINKRQAFILEGAEILSNDRGTAPGQWLDHFGVSILLLPGPPHELKSMFTRECLPRLERKVPKLVIQVLTFRVAGMSESDLDQLIAPVYAKYENPATTVLAAAGDIQVHLRARCATDAEAAALLAKVGGPIEQLLGDRIYSRNGDSLEATIGHLLRKTNATVAVAESCTGGLLGERITSVPGSSDYFAGGFITYSNAMKTSLLGVTGETLETYGPVSAQTAEAMALGARFRAAATYALSITGEAGPTVGDPRAPVGMVYAGLSDVNGTISVQRQFFGDRARIRAFSCQMAMDLLRKRMTR